MRDRLSSTRRISGSPSKRAGRSIRTTRSPRPRILIALQKQAAELDEIDQARRDRAEHGYRNPVHRLHVVAGEPVQDRTDEMLKPFEATKAPP